MDFEFSITIDRPVKDVFAFFRDVDQHAGKPGTVVPIYDKLTPGSVGVGTRYREVVQVLPFIRWEVISEVVRFEPESVLTYQFSGPGMGGELQYAFCEVAAGTRVHQVQTLRPRGILRLLRPIISKMFAQAAEERLKAIRTLLEQDPLEGETAVA